MKNEYLNIIKALYGIQKSELHTVTKHSKELDIADNAEDSFRGKLSDELKKEFDEVVFLRTAVNDLDSSDKFTDGFLLGTKLMLGILS